MATNGALGELLNLFDDDDDNDDGDNGDNDNDIDNNGKFKENRKNIDYENGGKVEEMNGNKKCGNSDQKSSNSGKKSTRHLIPVDFNDSKGKCYGRDGMRKITENNRNSNLLHSGETSSSEDEFERNHDHSFSLNEFGRSIKRQLNNVASNCSNSISSSIGSMRKLKVRAQENRNALQEKAQKVTKAVELSSKDTLSVYDPFFGIRVRNPALSSTAFESYCDGLKKVRLSQLKPFVHRDSNWISLAVIVEKTGCRKSANGNEYMIWKASDLLNPQDATVKILVFGDCIKKFWKLQLSSVIALVAPPFADGDDKQVTVKLTKCAQILEVGFCPDFSHCKAVKKDGGLCQNVVNLSQGERCIYHVQRAVRKITTNRGSFATILANHKQKQFEKSNSFTDGVITGPRRVAQVPTNKVTINESRKNIKQQQNTPCLIRSQSLKECEKMKLNDLIAKEAEICGTGRGASQQSGKKKNGSLGRKSSESLKDFLQKQNGNENSTKTTSPKLGKGLNSGSVLLMSPSKTFSRLNILNNAKQKAIAIIQSKGGLEKADPNSLNCKSGRKRLSYPMERKEQPEMKKLKALGNEAENAGGHGKISKTHLYTTHELIALLKKESSHNDELRQEDAAREQCYFRTMEEKEKVENFLTSTMEIKNCNVVICDQCNYKSHKQSDLCRQLGHSVKHSKADKRFFRCRGCHRRVSSYERMPTVTCTHCGDSNFERVAMKDERKVRLEQENLLIRGEERKYVNH